MGSILLAFLYCDTMSGSTAPVIFTVVTAGIAYSMAGFPFAPPLIALTIRRWHAFDGQCPYSMETLGYAFFLCERTWRGWNCSKPTDAYTPQCGHSMSSDMPKAARAAGVFILSALLAPAGGAGRILPSRAFPGRHKVHHIPKAWRGAGGALGAARLSDRPFSGRPCRPSSRALPKGPTASGGGAAAPRAQKNVPT